MTTKVIIVGDTHADGNFTANILRAAKLYDVTTIIQLGDFGYTWDKTQLDSITAWLRRDESHRFYWLDGNHDQHDDIDTFMEGESKDVPFNMRDTVIGGKVFPKNMYYLPRGCVFEVGSKRLLAMGGAYSIDEAYRTQGLSWWPQETIGGQDIDNAIVNADMWDSIDIMVTHDMPCVTQMENQMASVGYKNDQKSKYNRINLSRIVDHVRPQELYHGHMHRRYDEVYETPQGWQVQVHGVGANVNPRGYIDHTAHYDQNFILVHW